MVYLSALLIIALCFQVFLHTFWAKRFREFANRHQDESDELDGTMFEVRQLLMEGEREMAKELYGSIFDCSEIQAEKDIRELERSLSS